MPSWAEFYRSDLQSVLALLVLPFAFLVYRAAQSPRPDSAVAPRCAQFVNHYTLLFAFLTLLDPIATGPLLGWLGWQDAAAGSAVSFAFVYLGDFRVLALIFGVALHDRGLGRALGIAAGVTLIVPALAGGGYALLTFAVADLPGQVLWLIYELGFMTLALVLARSWIPRQQGELSPATIAFLRDVAAFAAVYYALWAGADLLITFAGLDAGWALRIVPNQLYYAVFIPFVYFRFFGWGARDAR
jgi:hypothetical protein